MKRIKETYDLPDSILSLSKQDPEYYNKYRCAMQKFSRGCELDFIKTYNLADNAEVFTLEDNKFLTVSNQVIDI